MVGLTIITCVCLTVVLFNTNRISSNASSGEVVYATFTNPNSKNETKLSNRSAYGKVSSKDGKIGYWLYNNATDYTNNKVNQKGVIKFKEDGTWTHTLSKDGKVILQSDGKDRFDIQSVFQMNKSGSYLNVKFYTGSYNVSNYYRLYSNTVVTGEGQGKSKLYKTNNSPLFVTFDDTFAKVTGYNGTKNVYIRNMTVDCYQQEVNKMYNSSVIFAAHGEKLLIDNVGVVNGIATHAIQLASMTNVRITNCLFSKVDYIRDGDGYKRMDYTYCTQNGLKETNSAFNQEVIQIESDVCGDSKNGLVYSLPTAKLSRDDTPTYGVQIKDNKFYRVLRAIGNHSTRSTNYQRKVLIEGNTFDSVLADAIRLPKFKDIAIKGNYFKAMSSTYVGGQRIRVIQCVNKDNKAYTNMSTSAKKLWGSLNYYWSSEGSYFPIDRNGKMDTYKITVQ